MCTWGGEEQFFLLLNCPGQGRFNNKSEIKVIETFESAPDPERNLNDLAMSPRTHTSTTTFDCHLESLKSTSPVLSPSFGFLHQWTTTIQWRSFSNSLRLPKQKSELFQNFFFPNYGLQCRCDGGLSFLKKVSYDIDIAKWNSNPRPSAQR